MRQSGRSERRRLLGASCIAALVFASALAIGASASSAATLAITVGVDPVESITTQVGVAGTVDSANDVVEMTVKPAGGPPCGPNSAADSGSRAINKRADAGGPFAETTNWTFDHAGSYLLCAWVSDIGGSSAVVVASTSQTLAVRIPHLALSISAPRIVLRGRTFQVTTTAQAETDRRVNEWMFPDTGRGCPANSGVAETTSAIRVRTGWDLTGGPTVDIENERISTVGRYLLCGYFDYYGVVPPEATAVATVTVVPPCVVPHLRGSVSLRKAKKRIVAAHCTVGAVRYARSRTHARGTVIALSPKPGTGHATHAQVQITVSSGMPRHRRRR